MIYTVPVSTMSGVVLSLWSSCSAFSTASTYFLSISPPCVSRTGLFFRTKNVRGILTEKAIYSYRNVFPVLVTIVSTLVWTLSFEYTLVCHINPQECVEWNDISQCRIYTIIITKRLRLTLLFCRMTSEVQSSCMCSMNQTIYLLVTWLW